MSKTIHQVWLGKEYVPNEFHYRMHTWKYFNPEWEYKLWFDQDLEAVGIPATDIDTTKKLILDKFGGIFADIQDECSGPF